MTSEQLQTEDLIKETARRLFFQKGHLNATTQEIADEAGVNRALIHYYFRSRDQLFEQVLNETMNGRMAKFMDILASDTPLRMKISLFLDAFIEQSVDFPYLENFLVTEMAKCPEKAKEYHSDEKKGIMRLIEKQLQEEVQAGRMMPITIQHFLANLLSLCNYPLITKPLIQTIFDFSEKDYRNFILERKKAVFRVIFNEDPPQ